MSGQQVPAWKRLGLKLKQPTGSDPVIGGGPTVGHPSSTQPNKRKLDAPPPSTSVHAPYASKKPRTDGTTTLKKQKSVTFGDTPTKKDLDSTSTPSRTTTTTTTTKTSKPASKGPSKKQPAKATPTHIQPALDYLRQWKSSRASWKFNKNHQITLIKYLFEPDLLPAADIDTFYDYIRDIKGYVRTRLRENAMEVRNRDEADGPAGFPEGTMDIDAKQTTYQSVLAELLQTQQGNKRKSFHEVEYVATTQDGSLIIRRVVKRMRAEIVMEELSDSEETETTTTTSSSETITASDNNNDNDEDAGGIVVEQPSKPEGSNRRRRKLRVSNMDDSSSSESESDSDSDTSSDSSSDDSDSDSDDEMAGAGGADADDTSSSSSSSSSEADSSSEESDSDGESEL